jgi:hypothetical protein
VPDRCGMRSKGVAGRVVGIVASSVLAVACADGGPLGNASFGFGTTDDPPDDSVGTFNPMDTSAGNDDPSMGMETQGATSVGPVTEGSSTSEAVVCGDGVVTGEEKCDGMELAGEDCITQGFDTGTLACAADCNYDTSACVAYECGNGVIEGAEACDGEELGGEDCTSQGFDMGTLACAGNCGGLDTSGCSDIACGNGVIEGTEECDGASLGGQTCVTQGFDGGALACAGNCAFDTGSCTLAPPPLPACAEQDLGSSVGSPVANGTTVGQDEDLAQSCGSNGAVDYVLRFIAPAAATYQFDTVGSGYDTVLSLHDACGGAAVACNDDAVGLQSQLSHPMAAGQQVLIAVSGYAGSTGNWTLNIVQL